MLMIFLLGPFFSESVQMEPNGPARVHLVHICTLSEKNKIKWVEFTFKHLLGLHFLRLQTDFEFDFWSKMALSTSWVADPWTRLTKMIFKRLR